VKMGPDGARDCLACGANDLGGTLMNESITRAAGAEFGQEFPPAEMRALIAAMHREPYQRTTLYGEASVERAATAMDAAPLTQVVNPPLQHRAKVKDRRLVRFGQA
jgi:FO synthase